MTKAKCFCGSEDFGVELLVFPSKTQIHLRCRGCQCLRRISSPGHSADYVVTPEFAKEPSEQPKLVADGPNRCKRDGCASVRTLGGEFCREHERTP